MKTLKRILFFIKFLEIRLRFVAILVVTALVVGYWDHVENYYERWQRGRMEAGNSPTEKSAPAPSGTATEEEFFCPMHTFVVRDAHGKCPICGMELIARKKGEKQILPEGVVDRVQASPERIMEAGVKVEKVGYHTLSRIVRAYGEVEADETRQTRVIARFGGRLEELMVRSTGVNVSKGQPLGRIYSPKFLAATEEYIQARKSQKRVASDPKSSDEDKRRASEFASLARQRLHLAGFSDEQLAALDESDKAEHSITLYAPFAGIVLEKNVLQGDMVEDGTPLFTLADLSSVWVQARVLEADLGVVKKEMPVSISTIADPGHNLFGIVDFIYPTLNAANRTALVRIVVSNKEMKLKPGMAVTIEFNAPVGQFEEAKTLVQAAPKTPMAGGEIYYCPMHPEVTSDHPGDCPKCGMKLKLKSESLDQQPWIEGYTCPMHPDRMQDKEGACPWCDCGMKLTRHRVERVLAVPEQAVIDTGARQIVYVESATGVYDAHEVTLGARAGSFYPVLKGLKLGDKIVEKGAFLIDAESRLHQER